MRQWTVGECSLLPILLEHPGQVLNCDQFLDLTRGRKAGPLDHSVDIQVSGLRRKIEDDPKRPALIETVRSGGYGPCVREERSTDIRLRESPIRNLGRAEVGVVRARQPRGSGRSVPAGRRPTSASAFAQLQSIARGNRRM